MQYIRFPSATASPDVNIHDSAGNVLNSTAGALDVNISGGTITVGGVGNLGDPVPVDAMQVGFEDQSGDLQNGKLSAAGNIQVSVEESVLPTGAATETTLSALNTKVPAQGQAAMAASVPVAIASNQSTLPVSAASLPLPSGAATETTLSSINTKTPALGQAAMAASSPVVIASDQSAVPISAASLPLPAGAATETTLAAMSAKLPAALGQTTMAASMSVTIASNQSAVPTAEAGLSYVNSNRKDYSSGSVTAGAWTELIASTSAASKCIYIFDSSGQTMELGTGAAASETRKFLIPPGGIDGPIPLAIPSGTRISIRAVSGTASSGENDVTLLG